MIYANLQISIESKTQKADDPIHNVQKIESKEIQRWCRQVLKSKECMDRAKGGVEKTPLRFISFRGWKV